MRRTPLKRTPIKRSTPLRAAGPARATVPVLRPRKCANCGEPFQPRSSMVRWCSTDCGAALAMVKLEKAKAKAARTDRATTRAQLEALKSLRELRSEAQTAFNAFVRWRDRLAGHGCICCGAPLDWNSTKPGGAVDAGHFVSRGSAIELAFDERNVNAQRKSCNRPGGTTRSKFTAGMTARHGEAVVAELEGPHDVPKLKHDDLRRIRDTYRRRAREMARSAKLKEGIEA